MSDTSSQFDLVIKKCHTLFEKKTKDYGTAWRILRLPSLTDQIYIKAQRIRGLQTNKVQKIQENPKQRSNTAYTRTNKIRKAGQATQINFHIPERVTKLINEVGFLGFRGFLVFLDFLDFLVLFLDFCFFPKLCLLGSQQYRPSTMCEGVTSGTVGSAAGTLAKYTHSLTQLTHSTQIYKFCSSKEIRNVFF